MSVTSLLSTNMRSPLARRVILYLILFSASITLVTTCIQLYSEYLRDINGIESLFSQVRDVHLRSFTRSLWTTNDNELHLQLKGLVEIPNIIYASVSDGDKTILEAGKINSNNIIKRQFEMHYKFLNKDHVIGRLTVVASLDNIYRNLIQNAITLLVNNAIRTFLVVIFAFIIFYNLVTRHLSKISKYFQKLRLDNSQPLELNRKLSGKPDELDHLVSSANNMINARMETESKLRRFRNALDSSMDSIFLIDQKTLKFVDANKAAWENLGYSREELLKMGPSDINPEFTLDSLAKAYQNIMESPDRRGVIETVHKRKDGTVYPVEVNIRPLDTVENNSGHGGVMVSAARDITARKEVEKDLNKLAYYDGLTELPNRILFGDRLKHALAEAKRQSATVAIMLLDLDNFKNVNDSKGHDIGDQLLRNIAQRLNCGIREGDTVARLGGDEFSLIFTGITDVQDVAQMAQSIISEVAAPIQVGGHEFFASASIGVSLYPTDGEDADSLLKYADSAMYHAKEKGRNTYEFYSTEMTANVERRMSIEAAMRQALERKELALRYQPQVNMQTGDIIGVEALIYWPGNEGEYLSPAQFIPVAEETGLIVPIGECVLETACKQLSVWHKNGMEGMTISVNVAPRQFRDPEFKSIVRNALDKSGLQPGMLCLEITERLLLEDDKEIQATLDDLKAIGIRLDIDDFGTGYSSLSYLKRFPIDRVKIDRSFVGGLVKNSDDHAIVRAIIALAKALNLQVIAEGVEKKQQIDILRSEECYEYQGYYFARPMVADDLEKFFTKYQPLVHQC